MRIAQVPTIINDAVNVILNKMLCCVHLGQLFPFLSSTL